MSDKRGLSAIVATLITILLVLVAIGIVWVVVQNIFKSGSEQIDITSKCLLVDVSATNVACNSANPAICNVTLVRERGTDEIEGAYLVFSNGTSTGTAVKSPGDVLPLSTRLATDADSGLATPDKVDVTVYFLDEGGKEQLCQQASSFDF